MDYAKRIAIAEEMRSRDPFQLAKLLFLWLLWGASIAAVSRLPALPAAALAVATGFLVVAGIGFLGHDIAHGSVVSGERSMRFWTFWSLTAALFVPYFLWVRWHNAFHHRYANTVKDSDRLVRLEEVESGLISYPAYLLSNRLGLSLQYVALRMWRIIYRHKGLADRKKRSDVASLLLVATLYAVAAFALGSRVFLLGVALPVLVSLVTVSYYIQSNHFSRPQTEKPDPVRSSADVSVPAIVDAFHSNFSAHTAHHLFPAIASRHYPAITTQIAREFPDAYCRVPFLRSVWENARLPKIVKDGRLLVTRDGRVRGELR